MAQLRGYIDEAVTTIQVDDTTNLLVDGGIVQIEDEKILYERATDKAILGCSRGYDSTTAVEHDDHTEVEPIDTKLPAYRLPEFQGTETPVDLETGVLQAEKGSRYTNTTNGKVYVNVADTDLPEWVELADTGDFTPAGADTQVQYNNSGALGATDKLTWDNTERTLQIGLQEPGEGHLTIDGKDQRIGSNGDSAIRVWATNVYLGSSNDDMCDITNGTLWVGAADNSTEVYLDGVTGNSYMMGSLLIGDDASAAATAALELKSTTKGLLLSRLTDAQRDAIVTPAEGLMIYNTDSNKLNFYNGAAWEVVTSAAV